MVHTALLCALVATLVGLGHSIDTEVKIEPSGRNLLVPIGSRQVLVCTVEHHESKESDVTWVRPYDSTSHTDKRNTVSKILNSDGTYTTKEELIIEEFTKDYNGEFECVLIADSKRESASITLTAVEESKPEAERFYFGNETVTLFCAATLSGDAKFKAWMKDNKTLETGEKYKILENKSLTIMDLDRDDAGKYIARYDLNDGVGGTYDCVFEYKAGPLVLDMDKSINRDEGESVDINCVVKGYPHPEIIWTKDNVVVQEKQGEVKFGEHENVPGARLTISSLKFDDEGIYKCRAHLKEFNETSEKSIKLRVKSKLAWLWPFLGIIAEAVVLVLLIFIFEKLKKKDGSEASHPHEQ